MEILTPNFSVDDFFEKLSCAENKLLMLDYDGTLAPFVVDRDKAFPYPEAKELLIKIIEHTDTRVVIVTGRAIKDIEPLLNLDFTLEIWGSHGRERLQKDGTVKAEELTLEQSRSLEKGKEVIKRLGLEDKSEFKPASVTIHWRGMDDSESVKIEEKVRVEWNSIAEAPDFEIHQFDGGIELKVVGKTKGDAVKTLIEEMGSETVSAYLGDDLTDEDAFAVNKNGINVLVKDVLKETFADVRITPPDEMISFLNRWLRIAGC